MKRTQRLMRRGRTFHAMESVFRAKRCQCVCPASPCDHMPACRKMPFGGAQALGLGEILEPGRVGRVAHHDGVQTRWRNLVDLLHVQRIVFQQLHCERRSLHAWRRRGIPPNG